MKTNEVERPVNNEKLDKVFTSHNKTIQTSRRRIADEQGLERVRHMSDATFSAFLDIVEHDMETKQWPERIAMEIEYRTTFNQRYRKLKE